MKNTVCLMITVHIVWMLAWIDFKSTIYFSAKVIFTTKRIKKVYAETPLIDYC